MCLLNAAVRQHEGSHHLAADLRRSGELEAQPPWHSTSLCPWHLTPICPQQISTGLGAGIPSQRAKGEWIEGVAIWVAVFLVSGVGGSPGIIGVACAVKPGIIAESDIRGALGIHMITTCLCPNARCSL